MASVIPTKPPGAFDFQEFLKAKFVLESAINALQSLLISEDRDHWILPDLNTRRHHLVEYDTVLGQAVKVFDDLDKKWHQLANRNAIDRQNLMNYIQRNGDYNLLFTEARMTHFRALEAVAETDLMIAKKELQTADVTADNRVFPAIPDQPVQADEKSLPSVDPFLPDFKLPQSVPKRPAPPRPTAPPRRTSAHKQVTFSLLNAPNLGSNPDESQTMFSGENDSSRNSEHSLFSLTDAPPPVSIMAPQLRQDAKMPVLDSAPQVQSVGQSPAQIMTPLVQQTGQVILPTATPNAQQVGLPCINSYIPLTPIQLPKFSGNNYKEWPAFIELFNATIDAQPYPAVYKLSVLRSLLEGPALNCIKTLPIIAVNYPEALRLLQKRYGNSSLIESSLHAELRTLPPASNNTLSLRKTLDAIELILSQLTYLNAQVNNSTMSELIMSKFPDPLYTELVIARRHHKNWSTDVVRERLEEAISVKEEIDQAKFKVATPSEANGKSVGKEKSPQICTFCSNVHKRKFCTAYRTPLERFKRVKELNICSNCFSEEHKTAHCSSPHTCKFCHLKHNSLLHFDSDTVRQNSNRVPFEKEPMTTHQSNTNISQTPSNIGQNLNKDNASRSSAPWHSKATHQSQNKGHSTTNHAPKTAWSHQSFAKTVPETENLENNQTTINAHSNTCFKLNNIMTEQNNGLLVSAVHLTTQESKLEVLTHGLFDTGCNLNFLSITAAKRLGLTPIAHKPLKVCGFGSINLDYPSCPIYSIQLTLTNQKVLPIIVFGIDSVCDPIPKYLVHSNNYAFEVDQQIQPHLLLGNSTCLKLIKTGLQKSDKDGELFLDTWIGQIFVHSEAEKDDWTLGNTALTPLKVDYHLTNNRYSVRWPFKDVPQAIDDHFDVAYFRCKSVWRKLRNRLESLERYDNEFRRMFEAEVIEVAPKVPTGNLVRYVPHHPVFKGDKIRVVFDASARKKDSLSLNELLEKGENLLPLLATILIRFRLPKYVIISDIAKAFNTLALDLDQRDITRFIWLKCIDKPVSYSNIIVFRFCRVAFGYTSSPWMLADILHEHLKQFGEFGMEILNSLYVDNFFWHISSLSEAIKTIELCMRIFSKASMELHEFNSNLSEFREYLNHRGIETPEKVKFLGVSWNVITDCFELSLPQISAHTLTKRLAAHFTGTVFDPLGFITPVLFQARLFIQELWKSNLKWDEPINNEMLENWSKIIEDWPHTKFIVPRQIPVHDEASLIELHTFTDASKHGRGVVSYLLVTHHNLTVTYFLQAKANLTPTKNVQSIPRLELAALLSGVELQHHLRTEMNLGNNVQSFIWCDNASALWWSQADKQKKLPVYVRRRVDLIQTYQNVQLRYVPGVMNIADVASRGCSASELVANKTWFVGPDWLKDKTQWPEPLINFVPDEEPLVTTVNLAVNNPHPTQDKFNFQRFSSWKNLVGTFFFIFKFFSVKTPNFLSKIGFEDVDLSNFNASTKDKIANFLVSFAQKQASITNKERQVYNLVQKEDGLIVRHTRLPKLAQLTRTNRPVYLPRDHPITKLIISFVHNKHSHVSAEQTFHLTRRNWFIPKGRNVVKSVIKNCAFCKRYTCKPYELPPFPDFPTNRVLPSRPFTYVGLDLFGPMKAKRGETKVKVYGVIFVCFVTRAVVVELSLNCTAQNILYCFRRFVARRGCPKQVLSDNAPSLLLIQSLLQTNTVTAQIKSNLEVQEFLKEYGITWKFIPAFAPWHGGVYESLICSVKLAIQRAIGRKIVAEEHLRTIFAEAEAIVNTRPISYISADHESPILSPADFLQTNPLIHPILVDDQCDPNDEEWTEKANNRDILIRSWEHSQVIITKLWKQFQNSYLTALQDRFQSGPKQGRSLTKREPEVGEIVLVRDPDLPRAQWRLAKIEKLQSEPYRSATIRLGERHGRRTTTTRPLNLLCPLEIRCVLIFCLILCLQKSVYACSNVATITADSTNCVENQDGTMDCQVQASTLITLLPNQQEACLQIVSENSTYYATYVIQPKKLRLIGRTSSVLFSRQTHVRTSHSRRCDRADGSDCFGSYCEEVGDNTVLKDVSKEAQDAVGYSRCHRSCGCAWCNKDGEAGCGLCSAGCLFYRFYMIPATDQVYRVFQTPTYDPVLHINVILPDLNSSSLILHPSLPQNIENINISLTVSDIPPLPILSKTFLESVEEHRYALMPETADLSIHLHCEDYDSAKAFKCTFPSKTCSCTPSEYQPNCVCSTIQWYSILKDSSLRLPLSMGNGAFLSFANNNVIVDTQFPSQLHISVNADQVRLVTHRSKCFIDFINVTGCLDCESSPVIWLQCYTNIGSTTATFECHNSVISPILCQKEKEQFSIKFSTLHEIVNDSCTAQCPANSFDFTISGKLDTKTIIDHQNETRIHDKVKPKTEDFLTSFWNSTKNLASSVFSFLRSWYLWIIIPLIILLGLSLCCFFAPQLSMFCAPFINRGREFFQSRLETADTAPDTAWTPMTHRRSWAMRGQNESV